MTKHRKHKAVPEAAAEPTQASSPISLAKDKPQPPPPPRLKSKREEGEVKPPGAIGQFINFFRDAKKELTRVTWPTRKETVKSTGILLVLVAISSAYLGLVDSFLSWILSLLVS
ncbi:MAG: preprotein translocase subunit SecE [Deltaproteobacteria bacterium]|jgi:preprotein translocase subunit SecE|nr:preprotein translocase subunit SecE [Deltaproteobacteria bacterium]